jgi:hypothetical protein
LRNLAAIAFAFEIGRAGRSYFEKGKSVRRS